LRKITDPTTPNNFTGSKGFQRFNLADKFYFMESLRVDNIEVVFTGY
jgi:hypothetical protein